MFSFLKNLFKKKPRLEDVLTYKNDVVIKNFLKHYAVSEAEAHEIFTETLKWLWLCGTRNQTVPMLSPMGIVDEMWHNFMLCTKEYSAFCNKYFGHFIHHTPTLNDEEAELSHDAQFLSGEAHNGFIPHVPPLTKPQSTPPRVKETELRETLSLVYDTLGEETVKKWYSEYPSIYSVEKIKALKKD